MSYKIIRMYFDKENRVTHSGLTLEEAQMHCNDPETSSSTASDPKEPGSWFDGYESE
jgi:hypothetical protein